MNAYFKSYLIVNVFFLMSGLFLYQSGQDAFYQFLREDGFAEWMQFLCFLSAGLVFGYLFYYHLTRKSLMLLSLSVLLLGCLAFLFAAIEEISWFQRILKIESSAFFLENNKQAETNLHNLRVGEISLNKDIIVKLIFLFSITHNLILPLVSRKNTKVRSWVESKGFFLPPLFLSLTFLAFTLFSEIYFQHSRRGELLEVFGSYYYLTISFAAYFLGVNYETPILGEIKSRKILSELYFIFSLLLVLLAWILGRISHN